MEIKCYHKTYKFALQDAEIAVDWVDGIVVSNHGILKHEVQLFCSMLRVTFRWPPG